MAKPQTKAKRQREVGQRLKEFREARNYSPIEMATMLKISSQRWYNYETGKRPLDIDVALQLKRLELLSLDYIFDGDKQLLPAKLARFLEAKAALLEDK